MWKPRDYQFELGIKGYHILKEHMIVYYAMEERTGKSLTSIIAAECCQGIEHVGIITTAKGLTGWKELFTNYTPKFDVELTTFGKAHREITKAQLIILDEAHKNISGYPKPSVTWKKLKKLTAKLPLIYLSATPHAQGYQMLFHQFALSSWSPWKRYKNFYHWFEDYGVAESTWVSGREIAVYTNTYEKKIIADTAHLFINKTRKELDFKYEPKDRIHYIELGEEIRTIYNELVKNKVYYYEPNKPIMIDTPSKLRTALHMLEGGVFKAGPQYFLLDSHEKIDYIKEYWGDVESLVIFYNYKAELVKLGQAFKKATLLQATAYAEGVDLTEYDTLVVYSQDTSTARHTQRRARQASKARDKEIVVHFLLVENAVSEQIYETVSINKKNFVDSVFEEKEI